MKFLRYITFPAYSMLDVAIFSAFSAMILDGLVLTAILSLLFLGAGSAWLQLKAHGTLSNR